MALASIEVQQLSLSFGSRTLFQNLRFSVPQQASLVVIGPSGSGKSSLLKVLAGLLPPTEGKVLIKGHSLYELNASERQDQMRMMGMLFQKNALFDSMTCAENVAFPLKEVTDFSQAEIRDRVEFFLQAVGLLESEALFPSEMSGGMQKRLGIARALALDPKTIFYDDPTAGLDPITSRRIIDLINKLKAEQSSSIVVITNDMNRAYQLGGTIAMLVDQELIITGGPEQTKSHPDPRVQQFIRGKLAGPLQVIA